MSTDPSILFPFPRVVEIDVEDLVSSGCLDVPTVDSEHLEARSVLALPGEDIVLPIMGHSPHSTIPPISPPQMQADNFLPTALSSPEIPLRTLLEQRQAENTLKDIHPSSEEVTTSSEEVPLSVQADERARLAKLPSVAQPSRAEPQTYIASLIPDLGKSSGGPARPAASVAAQPANASDPNSASQTAPSRDDVRSAKRLWLRWRQTNRKKVTQALAQPLLCPGVRLSAFADAEQSEWTSARAPEGGPRVRISGSQPHVLLGEDDVPVGWVFPNFLGSDAHRILFRDLDQFADDVEVTPEKRSGADANTRNKRSSYKRTARTGERSGCFQLVNIWGAVGHPDGQLGPATDVVGGRVKDFNAAAKLMDELRVVSKRIDHMIQCVDPAQHAALHKAREELREEFPAYRLLSQFDPSYFHGRSLIFNRATPRHRDRRDKKFAWTPVLTLGNYTSGTFSVLNYDIDYLPGTLILLRGAVFPHEVTYDGGARVCIAHFTHEYVVNRTSVRALPLMTGAEVAASIEAYRAKHAASALPKNNNPKKGRRRERDAAAASLAPGL